MWPRVNKSLQLFVLDREIKSVLSDTVAIVHSLPCSHSCGLFDAVEADPGGGRGDGHGSGHTRAEAVVVLPTVPPFPDRGTHLQRRGGDGEK